MLQLFPRTNNIRGGICSPPSSQNLLYSPRFKMALEDPPVERRPSDTEEGDEDRLAQFGYKQELKRDWGLAHNFGVSFSIIVSRPGSQGQPA